MFWRLLCLVMMVTSPIMAATIASSIRLDSASIAQYQESLQDHFRNRSVFTCHKRSAQLTCPAGTRIQILSAFYGQHFHGNNACNQLHNVATFTQREQPRSCSFSNAIAVVRRACDKKRTCLLWSSPEQFHSKGTSDPCPKLPKYLVVHYRCQVDRFLGQLICADSYRVLKCSTDDNQKMVIAHARTTNSIEFSEMSSNDLKKDESQFSDDDDAKSKQQCEDTIANGVVRCSEEDATSHIRQLCHKRSECTVTASQQQELAQRLVSRSNGESEDSISATAFKPSCARQHLFIVYACIQQSEFVQVMDNRKSNHEKYDRDDKPSKMTLEPQEHLHNSKTLPPELAANNGEKLNNQALNKQKITPPFVDRSDGNNSSDKQAVAAQFLIIGGGIGVFVVFVIILIKIILVRYQRRRRLRAARQARNTATIIGEHKSPLKCTNYKTEQLLSQTIDTGPPVTCYPLPSTHILLGGCGPLTDTSGSDRSSASLCHTSGGNYILHHQHHRDQQFGTPLQSISTGPGSVASTGSTSSRINSQQQSHTYFNNTLIDSISRDANLRSQPTSTLCTCSSCDYGSCICIPPALPPLLHTLHGQQSTLSRLRNDLQICTELVPKESALIKSSIYEQADMC